MNINCDCANFNKGKTLLHLLERRLLTLPRVPLAAGMFVWVCLVLRKLNLWDGVIMSYAFETGRYSGIKMQLMDADLESVYYLIRSEFMIANLLRTSFELVDRFLLLLSMSVICICLYNIMRLRFLLSSFWSKYALCIFLTFPVWHVLASTTQTFYIFFLASCMTGMHLVYKDSKYLRICGCLLIVISFEMNSLLLFTPALALLYSWTENPNGKFKKTITLPVFILLLSTGYWAISRSLTVPSGQYVGYNKMVQPFTLEGWRVLKQGISDYSTFLILPMIGISITCAAAVLFRSKFTSYDSGDGLSNRSAIVVVPLSLAAVYPYVLVYKSTPVDDFDWLGRHAILLSVPLSIAITFLVMHLVNQVPAYWGKKLLVALAFLVTISPQGFLLANGLGMKFERELVDQKLIQVLKPHRIPSGIVEVVGLPPQVPDHRVYESNYIFYRAYGDSKWWTRIGPLPDPNFVEPTWKNDLRYQTMFIYHPPSKLCRSVVTVDQLYKSSGIRRIKALLGLHVNTDIIVQSVETRCS